MNSETAPEPPEDLGNTIDGTRVGDGSGAGSRSGEPAAGIDPDAPGSGGHSDGRSVGQAGGEGNSGESDLDEQKRIYQTPQQPDHALGGSDGTADGM